MNSERDLDEETLLDDCRSVFSDIVQEEEVLEKKRRWLMGFPVKDKSGQKRLKSSNIFRDLYLPESYVRNDDVSLEYMRASINSASQSDSVATESHDENHLKSREDELAEILIKAADPKAVISPSLVSYINELLKHLEILPSQALIAMDGKLKNMTTVPQFAAAISCKRNMLIRRLRKQVYKILLGLEHGTLLPPPLAKALSIVCLTVNAKARKVDFLHRMFFPFSPEVNGLKNELLEAIWAVPRLKSGVLKQLQDLLSPWVGFDSDSDFSPKYFRTSLRKYLMDYLFHCDDLLLPGPLSGAVQLINQRSQRRPASSGNEGEEMEGVLGVSSQLRQIVWESLPEKDADEEYERYTEGVGTRDGSSIEIVDMDCSVFATKDHMKTHATWGEGVEGSGDSMLDESYQKEEEACRKKLDAKNWYQELVNVCDDASMIAFNVIGLLLDEFINKGDGIHEGNSSGALLRVIGELTPPFPKSVVERLETTLRSSSL